MKWSNCEQPAVGDSIRWKEPVFGPPVQKRGLPPAVGEQRVTAEVLSVGEFLELSVQAVEILSLDEGAVSRTKEGEKIRRKKSSLDRGHCQKWS